jgi:hypothetical protein
MFDRLSKKLRALEYWQIIALGVATLLVSSSVVLFGLSPLLVTLLWPFGQHVAGAVSLAAVGVSGFAIGHYVLPFFYWNFLTKKAEDAMVRIYATYEDLRKTDSQDPRQDG